MNNVIYLSKDVYDENTIRVAVDMYKSIAEIEVQTYDEKVLLIFNNTKYDTSETIKEFENCLIQLSVMSKKKYDNS